MLLNTSDRVELDRAVAHYRDRYTVTGLFENELVDGIMDVVDALCVGGLKLHVATSKPHAYAGRIVEHFGLEQKFGKVYGSELDGTRSAKAELLAHILAEEGVVPSECVMIGDRKHDLIGAQANGVAAIGVLWGYGSRQELEDQGPDYIAEKPADLLSWIKAG
ncbi:hypothetical protein GCM10011316_33010 [Roseibium aquae]|uniref:Phosphoglycolate phosphatase n=1 Tax=Roseibium aquae TaxID=1323746 RepID=A0A916TLV6_9HYPH|nr:hypothetical protein GCM10011316_33010 [Roseibium aquae]